MEDYNEKYKKLAQRLSELPKVSRYNEGDEKEAWTLAHAFLDLEESFNKFANVQLPQLMDEGLTVDEMQDLLLDIGENFRHILYHIHDPKFYKYLD